MLQALRNWWGGDRQRAAARDRNFRPTVLTLEDRVVPVTAVADLNAGLTPMDLARNLVGPNATITRVAYQGTNISAGIFQGGQNSIGLDQGVVLSNGQANFVVGPYNPLLVAGGTNLGLPGDPLLDTLAAPSTTTDAVILEIDFIPPASGVSILSYVYGSDEYTSLIFNRDPMAITLNGNLLAFIPGTTTPINAATINNGVNPQFFVDNTAQMRFVNMEGFTTPFTSVLPVIPGQVNTFTMSIADAGNDFQDSWLFLVGGALGGGDLGTYRPLRTIYNAATDTYEGTLTYQSFRFDIPAPTFGLLPTLPFDPINVNLENRTGVTPLGQQYITLPNNGAIPRLVPSRVSIQLSNPQSQPLGTYFVGFDVSLTSNVT